MTEVSEAVDTAFRADVTDSVLRLTLTRASKGNALRQQDCADLRDQIGAVDGSSVRAILIRAEGKVFCAGADLVSANEGGSRPRVGHLARGLESGPHGLISAIWNCPVPTVSVVQGKALGLGLHVAIACDFTIAGSNASFAEPFCKRGFSADSGGTFLLPRLIGLRRARQMLFRGISVSADTAKEWGLIDEVVESDALDLVSTNLVAELAQGPTYSLEHTKNLLNAASEDIEEALTREATSVEATVRSADFKEGIRAFVERRDPVFTGA